MIIEKQKLKKAGFTLIEMVVVMGMIGIVSMATLKLVRFSDINKNLTLATAEVKGTIRTAQTLALAPPIKTNGAGDILHICGFVVRNDNSIGYDNLEIDTVTPTDGKVETCRNLKVLTDVCGSTTTCEEYETRHFDGFSVKKEGTDDVKIFFRAPYGEVIGGGVVITINQTDENGNPRDGYSKSLILNKQGKINVQ